MDGGINKRNLQLSQLSLNLILAERIKIDQPIAQLMRSTQSADSNSGWGQTANVAQAANLAWGQITDAGLQTMNKLDTLVNPVTAYMEKATTGEGALSMETHARDMKVVDASLTSMLSQVETNLGHITKTVEKFMQEVWRSNEQVGKYCNAVLQRGINAEIQAFIQRRNILIRLLAIIQI